MKEIKLKPFFATILAAGIAVIFVSAAWGGSLQQGFITPPDSAKPQTWWHWMNGNITKEGITADLEAMQRVGIGGAQIVNVGCDVPEGPIRFLSPEWYGMVDYAAQEAKRLGLTLGIENCGGWSSSGGPWVTPDQAMQQLVTREVTVTGPSHFSGILPQPPTKLDFYRDIEVLACPVPKGADVTLQTLSPKVTSNVPGFNGQLIFDGDLNTTDALPKSTQGQSPYIQFELAQPLAARSVWIYLGSGSERAHGVIQASDDGQTFRDLQKFMFPYRVAQDDGHQGVMSVSLGNNPAPARFYRIQFAIDRPRLNVAEISISPALCTDDAWEKSGMNLGYLTGNIEPDFSPMEPGLAIDPQQITNLTSRMTADGHLSWDVPAGSWVIQRIGYTPIGVKNHPAPIGGEGLECDKLSAKAMDMYWAGFVQKVLDKLGPLAGKGATLDGVLIDSYEVGGQNWTPEFRQDFQRNRGYDPLPWLATVTGKVVESPDTTERFLWDMRRTIADLFAENYYGRFRDLCHQHGLSAYIEPYAGPFEALQSGAAADIPMGEFWMTMDTSSSLKLASSIGHIYGKPFVGAEAFTSAAKNGHGRWLDDPYAMKSVGDQAFCDGVNRFIFHRYAMQPWTNRWPGMTMGPWGTHLERTVTWWEQGRAWMSYLARSQFMLQQGRYVADAAAFCGESAPVMQRGMTPPLPVGYNYDCINADVLLHHAAVKDGRLVLDSGMQYRVLALVQPERTMTPTLLSKLRDFVGAGLTLIGPSPERSPSLENYPQCDASVKSLATELWGDCNGTTVTEHRFGKGRVIWGRSFLQIFSEMGIPPDFEFPSAGGNNLEFIHRRSDAADIYFISNQRDQSDSVDCTFRVSGKVPELWHPDAGKTEDASVWHETDGRITVPLRFDPSGSVFVVFRRKSESDHIVSTAFSVSSGTATAQSELTIQSARYEAVDDSKIGRDVTALLAKRISNGRLEINVDNPSLGGDPASLHRKQLRVSYTLGNLSEEKTVQEGVAFAIGANESALPALQLVTGTDGMVLRALHPGEADLMFASGKRVKIKVDAVPEAVEVSGPWEVIFPPDWGAPARIVLPKLMSWTDCSDQGVKYFSGTAAYIKDVNLPNELFGTNTLLRLDLGQVKNIAEVSVNGKDLGILWKPPFSVDITKASQPGKNRIEIKVTNLWPNRLIGDEQQPPDCEWNPGGSLKEIPQWVKDGKPSPTGRLTFTTWHHWHQNDKLILSGLLGPVSVQAVKSMKVPQ